MIDTHAHINKFYYPNIDEILEQALLNGIEKIIVPGTSLQDSRDNQQFKNNMLFYAIGIHPETQDVVTREVLEKIYSPEIIAIGECGLDYYYKYTTPEEQEKKFRVQIEYAIEKKLPLIVHTREALQDTYNILSDYYKNGDSDKGVIHSAAGDIKILEKIENLGFYLSFNGISTFHNAQNIRDIIFDTDTSKILIETDSPFLSPVPVRNQKQNSPSNIKYILENIQDIKGKDLQKIIYNNSKKLFNI